MFDEFSKLVYKGAIDDNYESAALKNLFKDAIRFLVGFRNF